MPKHGHSERLRLHRSLHMEPVGHQLHFKYIANGGRTKQEMLH